MGEQKRSDRYEVRLARPDDLDRIEAIVAAAYESYMRRMGFPPIQLLRDDSEAIEAGHIWVAGDPIVGAIILIELDDTLLVENLAVDPSAQSTGLGRQLMEHAEETAARLALRRVVLHRNEVNLQHQGFFVHLGYSEADRRSEHGQRRAFMEKLVPAAV